MKYQFKPFLSTPIHNQHSENEPFFSHENNANKSNEIQNTNNNFFSKSPKKPFFNKMNQPHGVSSLQKKTDTHHNPSQQKHNSLKVDNKTGLPDNLKSGVENLSGYSMDDVKVHYNSDKPAQVNALAYAQGTDIHIAAGQEKHLPHEAWHTVQQKRGIVPATKQLKQNVKINDNPQLEHDANIMSEKAMQMPQTSKTTNNNAAAPQGAIQTIAEPVLQGVLISENEVSVDEFEENEDYEDLRNGLDEEDLFQITMTALEHHIINAIEGINTSEWLASIKKQLAGRHDELKELRAKDQLKAVEERKKGKGKMAHERDKEEVAEEKDDNVVSKDISQSFEKDKALQNQIGKISKVLNRAQKYIIFCEQGVLALSKAGNEGILKNEFDALVLLHQEGCSAVPLISQQIQIYECESGNFSGYMMKDVSGLHSKQDDNSFKRQLFDLPHANKEIARQCLKTIFEFSQKFTIGDLQLILMPDGKVFVLDPLGVKKEKSSEVSMGFIANLLERLDNEALRPVDEKPNKGEKAD